MSASGPSLPTVTVSARGAARIASGHPWVYRQDVVRGPERDARDGGPALVRVLDGRTRHLAVAMWAAGDNVPLALRVIQRGDLEGARGQGRAALRLVDVVDAGLDAALARRRAFVAHGPDGRARDAYRVAHAEADGLPGLIIDRYGDVAVVQTIAVAMDAALADIGALVASKLGVKTVIARNDGSARDFEGLDRRVDVLVGTASAARVQYHLGANVFEADLLEDHKTGGFLDQADNHAAVAALAPDGARALDAFTHHGGFALALARRGGTVLANDLDAGAAQRSRDNARRNGLGNVEVRQGDAWTLLRELEGRGEAFDVVVLDPPALAKRGGGPGAAAHRPYVEMILRGLRLVRPGGLVAACSCSGKVTRTDWDDLVTSAAADAGRTVQILERRGAALDHPERVGVPETAYLKCWILRVV